MDKIKDFIMTDNGIEMLKLIGTVVISYITAKITAKNTKKSLTTQYFKEKGTETQEKLLSFWCGLIMNGFKINISYQEAFSNKFKKSDTEILRQIQKESYVYCSSRTIKAIKEYQQYIYKHNSAIKNNEDNQEITKTPIDEKITFAQQFVLITRIISRMKYDFTGEKVDELDLIKIRIKDLNLVIRFLLRIILWYYNIKEVFINILLIFIAIATITLLYFKIFK